MKLGIISTIWKRPWLTRLFLEYYERLADTSKHELVRVAVYSSDEDLEIVQDAGLSWNLIQAPNQPITSKHNAGAEFFRGQGVDAVVNMPSDDFFTPGYFDFLSGALEAGHDFVRFGSLYFASLDQQKALYGRRLYNAAGAMISRSILDKVDWMPWTENKTHATDAFLIQNIQKHFENPLVVEDTLDYGFVGVDFKIKGDNLNSFDHLSEGLQHSEEVDIERMLSHFPSIKDEVLNWNKPKRTRIKKNAVKS